MPTFLLDKSRLKNAYFVLSIIMCSYVQFLNVFLNNSFLIVLPGSFALIEAERQANTTAPSSNTSASASASALLYIQSANIITVKQLLRLLIILANVFWIDRVPLWLPLCLMLATMLVTQVILVVFEGYLIMYVARCLEAVYSSLMHAWANKALFLIRFRRERARLVIVHVSIFCYVVGDVVGPMIGAFLFYRFGRRAVFVANTAIAASAAILGVIWRSLQIYLSRRALLDGLDGVENDDNNRKDEEEDRLISKKSSDSKLTTINNDADNAAGDDADNKLLSSSSGRLSRFVGLVKRHGFVALCYLTLINNVTATEGLMTVLTIWAKAKFQIGEREISQTWAFTGLFALPAILAALLLINRRWRWPHTRYTTLMLCALVNAVFWTLIPVFPAWHWLWLPIFVIFFASQINHVIDQALYFEIVRLQFGGHMLGRYGLAVTFFGTFNYFACATFFGHVAARFGFECLCYAYGGFDMALLACFAFYKYYFDLAGKLRGD